MRDKLGAAVEIVYGLNGVGDHIQRDLDRHGRRAAAATKRKNWIGPMRKNQI